MTVGLGATTTPRPPLRRTIDAVSIRGVLVLGSATCNLIGTGVDVGRGSNRNARLVVRASAWAATSGPRTTATSSFSSAGATALQPVWLAGGSIQLKQGGGGVIAWVRVRGDLQLSPSAPGSSRPTLVRIAVQPAWPAASSCEREIRQPCGVQRAVSEHRHEPLRAGSRAWSRCRIAWVVEPR